ncbi:MAG: hypothetical protein COS42_12330 [Flavobacteriales bacterium CG03_land_8_20_14_0_80_35_15]|nr:MAG: hypothetical protein COS42_12330 [Flavobacteriales bacterium CG03_land_8_20_14_0_80_35_15]PIX06848.1 MAG: hypothetical protein COZ76_06735 [Flavobacteriales bacterium CG_4_8_14_3_um_filter_35_10]PJA05872.1 MAG: hypothetical protein COX71_04550 [Flavobacteriales bacterium CG_4_10_14_0_2_um_filter_35_18]
MRKISFLFFIIFSCQLFSQTNYIDSVEQSIVNLSDEKQIKTILAIPYDKIIANTTKAEKLFLTTLSEAKKINHPEFEADISNQLALIYAFLGKYDKRLTYNLQAIKIYESIENKLKAGRTYGDLGFSMYRRDIKKAKFYMQKGIKLLKEKNDFVDLNPVYDNYGIIQEVSGNTDSAIYYYNLALDLKRNQSDSIGIPFALGHLSGAYLIKKDFKKAKEYLDESYFIRKNRKDIYGIVECLALYGDFYFAQENYKEALSWFTDCYHLAIENKYLQAGQYAAEFASKSYEKIGDFVNTIKFLKIQQTLKDSMLNMTTNKVIAQLEVQFETEKKEKQLAEQEIKITKEQLRVKQGNYTLIGLGLVLVFLLILGRYIYQQQKFKQQKLIEENRLKDELAKVILQNELYEERTRISKDLHDNIGSQLTFIISSVDNIGYLLKTADEKLKEKLNGISNFSRTTITQLRDTIWALNKDEISFDDLKSRLLNYIESAKIAKENISFIFHAEVNNNIHFNAIQGINIYRVVQEAINNAIKYSAATTLNISLEELNNKLQLKIQDDGIGFHVNEVTLGSGLENMKNRAIAIHAQFQIDSTPEKGTTIILSIPINKTNAV